MSAYNPYDNVLSTIKKAADLLGLKEKDYITTMYPERELKVSFPVKMDDGSIRIFEDSASSIPVREGHAKAASAIIRTPTLMKSRRWPPG